MVRRARKATARELASYQRNAVKGNFREMKKEALRVLSRGIQSAVITSMNGLAQAGPAWSGEFSSAWDFVPDGEGGRPPRGDGAVYTYSKKDVNITRIEKFLNSGVTRFEIVNTSEHANIAIDAEPAIFKQIGDPVKPNIYTGWRPTSDSGKQVESIRGDLDSATFQDGTAGTATAPYDWYVTYTRGGKLILDFGKGFSAGFRGTF